MILSAKSIRIMLEMHPDMITPKPKADFIEGGLLLLHLAQVTQQKQIDRTAFIPGNFTPNPQPVVVIGKNERIIPEDVPLDTFFFDDKEWYWLDPGVPYLLQSVETVCLPPGVEAKVCTRTSMFRGGGHMDREWVPYGFDGQLTVQYDIPIRGLGHKLEKGGPVMALKFFWVDNGDVLDPCPFDINTDDPAILDGYRGIYSKDKRTTKGRKERGT